MHSVRKFCTFGLLAVCAVLIASSAMGYPLVDPMAIAGIGMVPFAMSGEVTLVEIKGLVEDLGKTHKEYRETNDALLKAKAEGKAVGDLEAKLVALDQRMDTLSELKTEFDKFVLASQRPGGGTKDHEALATEAKTWNLMLRSDFQTKGRPAPAEVSSDEYVHYKSAFFALARHGNIEKLSADERKALSAGSDPDGGYLLPASTVGRMVKRVYERSVMRRLALVVPISTDALEGISDNDETDAGWVTEIGTRNDTDTPTVGKYRIQAEEMYAQPKVTQKLIDDAATDVEAWLADKVADKFARVEGTAFLQGTGVGQPRGLCTYSTVATGDDTRDWAKFEHVVTGANGAFHTDKADPLQSLLGAFRDEYLQNANWLMRREVRTLIRKMKEATSDRYLWEPSLQMGQPDRLLGYPVNIDQHMPTIATGSLSLAFGDFREAYTIVDRLGVRTLRDPYTAKPYVRFYSTKRSGGGAVNFEAVKFLKFST
jgi:HK97 family phage major capsid protein